MVECQYFNIGEYSLGHAVVWQKSNVLDEKEVGTWGIIDQNGEFTQRLQPAVIFHCRSWGEDEQKNPKWPALFGMISSGTNPEMRLLKADGQSFTNNKCGLRMSQNQGESLFPVVMPTDFNQFRRTGIWDEHWGQFGFLNSDGSLAISHQFTTAEPFSEGFAAVSQGKANEEQWGFIDESGTIVVKPQFTKVRSFSEGIAPVKVGDMWGYIDQHGSWIKKPAFAEATPFSGGIAFVKSPKAVLGKP